MINVDENDDLSDEIYTDLHIYHSTDGKLFCRHGIGWGRGYPHHSPWLVEDSHQYHADQIGHIYHRTSEVGHVFLGL